jgi:hypothetical protein
MFASHTATDPTMQIRIGTEATTIIAVESIAIVITVTGAGTIIDSVQSGIFPPQSNSFHPVKTYLFVRPRSVSLTLMTTANAITRPTNASWM